MSEPDEFPERLPVTLPDRTLIEFQLIPACLDGFRMGSRGNYEDEEPVTRVVIPEPFYLGTVPVTQAQYRTMANACFDELEKIPGNKGASPSDPKGDQHPVENVSWDEAMTVGRWLSRSGRLQVAGLAAGWQAGLPSESMWEYACRAGTETEFWRGDGAAALAEVGWFRGNSGDETHPVGELPANRFGLHDMHGNVWEWCADAYDEFGYRTQIGGANGWGGSNEARQAADARSRVLRGGSWNNSARYCRSAYRDRNTPGDRFGFDGFRLCVFLGPGDKDKAGGSRQASGAGDRSQGREGRRSRGGGGGGAPDTISLGRKIS